MVFFQLTVAVSERAIFLINPIIKAKTDSEMQKRITKKMKKIGLIRENTYQLSSEEDEDEPLIKRPS